MAASNRQSVLTVCTANRCRSPLAAEVIGTRAARSGLPWTTDSAGVWVRPGSRTEPEVIAALGEIGISAPGRPSQRLTPALAEGAGLVLTATRAHRSAVLEMAPRQVGRVFTLLEIERLLRASSSHEPLTDFAELAARADAARAAAGPGGVDDDLADPIGRPLAAFRTCRDTVDRVAAVLVASMTGTTRPGA